MRCIAVCTARQYQLRQIAQYARTLGYHSEFDRNVLILTKADPDETLFFFQDGCFVYWGPRRRVKSATLQKLTDYSLTPLAKPEADFFLVRPAEAGFSISTHARFHVDLIQIDSEDTTVKLAASYALAQSAKLQAFEAEITQTIMQNSALAEDLAHRGKIGLSRKALSKRMGKIFIARNLVNLNSEFLNVPKYFWHNPTAEADYTAVAEFLDIDPRVDTLNKKLDTLHETLDILTSELQHKHSSLLELIIIVLIAGEIVLTLIQMHF